MEGKGPAGKKGDALLTRLSDGEEAGVVLELLGGQSGRSQGVVPRLLSEIVERTGDTDLGGTTGLSSSLPSA